jgi:drug/metabolite transporter (DMT)-like permease
MKSFVTYLSLGLAATFWGANFYFGKLVVGYMSPEAANTLRFGIAAIILTIVLFLAKGLSREMFIKKAKIYLILAVIGIYGFNMLFLLGLKYTSSVNGSLIMGLNPLLTAILSYFFLRTSINLKQLIAISISFAGVVIIISAGSFSAMRDLNFSLGDILLIMASTSFAIYNIINRKYMSDVSPLHTTAITTIISAILFYLSSLFMGKNPGLLTIPTNIWEALLFMSIFGSILAYIFWNKGVSEIGANKASLFTNIIPLSGALISVAMGHELVNYQILGGIFILVGVTGSMLFKND